MFYGFCVHVYRVESPFASIPSQSFYFCAMNCCLANIWRQKLPGWFFFIYFCIACIKYAEKCRNHIGIMWTECLFCFKTYLLNLKKKKNAALHIFHQSSEDHHKTLICSLFNFHWIYYILTLLIPYGFVERRKNHTRVLSRINEYQHNLFSYYY